MERKWTPGPWRVEYKYGDMAIIADGDSIMCDMTYYPLVPDNPNDWHLIAAAPDLYDALEKLINALDVSFDDDPNAYTALAKARGDAV